MLKKQNSEHIFIQPIDQHYELSNDEKNITDDDKNEQFFFDDLSAETIDFLNLSTDDFDSDSSYRSSISLEENHSANKKFTGCLETNWQGSISNLKQQMKSSMINMIQTNYVRYMISMGYNFSGQGLNKMNDTPIKVQKRNSEPIPKLN
jgi:hypothetical protein